MANRLPKGWSEPYFAYNSAHCLHGPNSPAGKWFQDRYDRIIGLIVRECPPPKDSYRGG